MVTFRTAGSADAEPVAQLHADSWRRHYRGAYTDEFLDGDGVIDFRREAWTTRLSRPDPRAATVLAEDDGALIGFVHVVLDHDETWGSLVDNLHVSNARKRAGIGTALLARAARAALERAGSPALYLWVLEQNTAAQEFYRARGGAIVEKAPVTKPEGYLRGSPVKLRVAWPDGMGR